MQLASCGCGCCCCFCTAEPVHANVCSSAAANSAGFGVRRCSECPALSFAFCAPSTVSWWQWSRQRKKCTLMCWSPILRIKIRRSALSRSSNLAATSPSSTAGRVGRCSSDLAVVRGILSWPCCCDNSIGWRRPNCCTRMRSLCYQTTSCTAIAQWFA
eukprot:SAG31_NODE_4380_length_3288_cov_3.080903_4_plen_158_part_00